MRNRLTFLWLLATVAVSHVTQAQITERVLIDSNGWELVGDLHIPDADTPVPAVLMLNRAAGSRAEYESLAAELTKRGIASLRLDLRGHGDSINLGRFIPEEADEETRERLIWDSQEDVIAAHRFLAARDDIDPSRLAMIGGSYSGEEMAEAGRLSGYARAYVELSPGSFSDESIHAMDESPANWLFVVAREERFLHEIAAAVFDDTRRVELLYVPGTLHASQILVARPDVAERIAVWLAHQLRE